MLGSGGGRGEAEEFAVPDLPDRGDLRGPIGIQGSEVAEERAGEQVGVLRGDDGHGVLLQSWEISTMRKPAGVPVP
ncbi:hypothetical protein GCM10010198_43100 [Nocardia seriolae]|nr:hypothetical protein NSERKGN1266_61670 [Nocardia seriolae]BEK93954.1 hypothetical protein NSER024013_18600 [Nocardia seriolae]GEM24323.1 hypothetical protein NS2_25620 [Nocardia seriolae NBRC 15557]